MCGVDVAQIGVDLTPAQTAQSVSVTRHTHAQRTRFCSRRLSTRCAEWAGRACSCWTWPQSPRGGGGSPGRGSQDGLLQGTDHVSDSLTCQAHAQAHTVQVVIAELDSSKGDGVQVGGAAREGNGGSQHACACACEAWRWKMARVCRQANTGASSRVGLRWRQVRRQVRRQDRRQAGDALCVKVTAASALGRSSSQRGSSCVKHGGGRAQATVVLALLVEYRASCSYQAYQAHRPD